jgi:hypothetical protein
MFDFLFKEKKRFNGHVCQRIRRDSRHFMNSVGVRSTSDIGIFLSRCETFLSSKTMADFLEYCDKNQDRKFHFPETHISNALWNWRLNLYVLLELHSLEFTELGSDFTCWDFYDLNEFSHLLLESYKDCHSDYLYTKSLKEGDNGFYKMPFRVFTLCDSLKEMSSSDPFLARESYFGNSTYLLGIPSFV